MRTRALLKSGSIAFLVAMGCSSKPPITSAPTLTAADVANSDGVVSGTARAGDASVLVPPDARLLGSGRVSEIRAFADEATGDEQATFAEPIRANAIVRSYVTSLSYDGLVDFVDRTLETGDFAVHYRGIGRAATYWSFDLPNGMPARVAVRDTTPANLEIVSPEMPRVQVCTGDVCTRTVKNGAETAE
jgi:hypothetical protein